MATPNAASTTNGNAAADAASLDWFAAWLPKSTQQVLAAKQRPVSGERGSPGDQELPPQDVPVPSDSACGWIREARACLVEVQQCLLSPTAEGLQSALPYLEKAVAAFSRRAPLPEETAQVEIDALRAELRQANHLFENAYAIQAGWARELGLTMQGTPDQLQLYGHSGHLISVEAGRGERDGEGYGRG